MIDPVIISTSLNTINLCYSVICVDKNVRKRFAWLLEDFRLKRLNTVKLLSFADQ